MAPIFRVAFQCDLDEAHERRKDERGDSEHEAGGQRMQPPDPRERMGQPRFNAHGPMVWYLGGSHPERANRHRLIGPSKWPVPARIRQLSKPTLSTRLAAAFLC